MEGKCVWEGERSISLFLGLSQHPGLRQSLPAASLLEKAHVEAKGGKVLHSGELILKKTA